MNDGSIVFSTRLDNAKMEKQLSSLTNKIMAIQDKINLKQAERAPLAEQSTQIAAQLDAAKAQLDFMKSATSTFSGAQIAQQEGTVAALQTQYNGVQTQVERYDAAINKANIELDMNREKAGALAAELATAGTNTNAMGTAAKAAGAFFDKITARITRLATRVLFFSVITMALRGLREWLGNIIKVNPQAEAAIARLRAALLTLAQPLVNVIIPAFTSFVEVLTVVIMKIAEVFAFLSGMTIEESAAAAEALNKQTEALDNTGAAAKKAGGELASFDQINKIGSKDSGGNSNKKIEPNFKGLTDETGDKMKGILATVGAIAAGLLTWKIASAFTDSLKLTGGLAMALAGAVLYASGLIDAWNNNVSLSNLIETVAGAALVIGGLALAFGPVAAGIAAVVLGAGMLVVGFRDVIENGFNLQNTLMIIAGIFAAGLGIALITGSWIPLLIAGIAALLLAITVAWGRGDELLAGAKEMLQGFLDFFTGIFTGNIALSIQGIREIFDGLKTAIFAIVDSLKDMFNSFLDWLDEKTGGRLSGIIDFVRGVFNGFFDWFKTSLGVVIDAAQQIMEGLVKFIAGVFTGDWDAAWEGVMQIFKGAWNGIVGLLEAAVNLIIKGINWLISRLNEISFTVPSWVPGIGGKSIGIDIPEVSNIEIPRLANGAVIPPNREFLAVLGDQTRGTNIEAPLETIVEAFKRVSGSGDSTQNITVYLDGEVVYRNQQKVSRRHGKSLA